jgi:hypothetical protein
LSLPGGRPCSLSLPPDHLLPVLIDHPVVLLHPDHPQRLDGGQLAQPARRARGTHRLQQVVAVPAVLPGELGAGALASGQAQVVDPLPVDLLPGGVDDAGQPVGDGGGQGLQRRPHGLPGQFQPVQAADRRQHVRGVGPLPPPGSHQAQLFEPVQQQVEDCPVHIPGHQPAPELAQHREIKALIIQRQAQAVLPVQPPPHRIGRLPVGQVLSELQHGHHRQLRRGDPRLPPRPVRRGECPIVIPAAQLVAGPHRQCPLPERLPGDPGGISWHLRPRMRLHRHDDPILRPGTGKGKPTAERS